MNKVPIWQLPKAERRRIKKWRKDLDKRIYDAIDEVARCQNKLNNAIFQRESFKKQLTLLEEQFNFDP